MAYMLCHACTRSLHTTADNKALPAATPPAVGCSQHVALEAVRQGRQWVTDQVGWLAHDWLHGLLASMRGFSRHAAARPALPHSTEVALLLNSGVSQRLTRPSSPTPMRPSSICPQHCS